MTRKRSIVGPRRSFVWLCLGVAAFLLSLASSTAQPAESQPGIEGGWHSGYVDAAGHPHISYYELDNGDLKVARVAAPQESAILPLVSVDRGGAP